MILSKNGTAKWYCPEAFLLDIGHSSVVGIKDIIEVLDMPAPSYSSFRDITEEDDPNDTIEVYSGPVGTAVAGETQQEEELSEEEPAQQMATPDPTPDRETGHSTESAGETHAIRSATRQPTEVPPDAVAMGTRSRRRQAYIAALSRTAELTPYYSAFSAGLQKAEIDT
jgi:hypothetical protein